MEYIATATDLNYFIFRSNYYALPAFRFKQGDKVLIEIVGDFINVYDAETKEFVARHKLLIGKGLTSKLVNRKSLKIKMTSQKRLQLQRAVI